MKTIFFLYFGFICFKLDAQSKFVGHYHDYFGSAIDIYSDSTFKYSWRFDMQGSWTTGSWRTNNDTIYFSMIPIYDTLAYVTMNTQNSDSLILSVDETPRRITMQEANILYSGGQNKVPYPPILFYQKSRMYRIDNQKRLDKKWEKGFWTGKRGKKLPPWFIKDSLP